MNFVRHSGKGLMMSAVLMTAFASSVQAMPFCGKSGYRSGPYPIIGYTPTAPVYYGPAYYGYGNSVPAVAYPQYLQPLYRERLHAVNNSPEVKQDN
jgi:hypothetical protein